MFTALLLLFILPFFITKEIEVIMEETDELFAKSEDEKKSKPMRRKSKE